MQFVRECPKFWAKVYYAILVKFSGVGGEELLGFIANVQRTVFFIFFFFWEINFIVAPNLHDFILHYFIF